ncbi:MAG TPA: MOSC domain-containing protein [Nitrososphaerales archaeon]|nr:MOSC domain-containing protein [Nitrososphaerales archaeon]
MEWRKAAVWPSQINRLIPASDVPGEIRQINVKPEAKGEHGLPKKPIASAFVARAGIVGDFNVYRHEERRDDPDQALLVMPIETIRELNSEGWPIKPGDLGENFTTSGIPYGAFEVGRVFAAGQVRLQIAKACDPCDNLFLLPYVGGSKGPGFLKVMLGRRGWYARVLTEGRVRTGDRLTEETTESASA